uniref:NADH dehydrogenase subunit 2 n=1 Tax=Fulgoraria rupestris rupestris TaxID=3082331 RepID=UPI002A823EEE|nr:NADH dehydrogenase subunit 2 [Fulgoraria rupestris rupestris]WOJ51889.1 NADH dehydrogenase subunit 2 [Fulgoraria rupestris rupestris]
MFSSLPFNYLFMLVMMSGTLFSISSSHWLGIWAGLEINLIGFLPMLVYQKSISESESAVKYFIIQALGSGLLMFGSLIMCSGSFTWDVCDSSHVWSILGFIAMMSGLCTKMGLFPFHYWFPGVMAGLPWLSCLLLTTWQKVAPLFLVVNLFDLNQSYWLIMFLCLASMGSSVTGGIGGMNQTQIRALLAYSSIGHLGWIMFSVIHGEWVMKVYFSMYVLISICMFLGLWHSDSGIMKNLDNLKDFSFTQLGVMILFLSLGGLPPLLGFISKWLVVMVSTSNSYLLFLLVLIIGSLMSLFYYLSLFFSMILSYLKKQDLVKLHKSHNIMVPGIIIINMLGGVLILLSNSLNLIYALVIFY